MHRIKYFFFFFCQYDENKFGKVYKKGTYKVENRMKKIVQQKKICLTLWRAQCKKNAPDRKKPVRGIWGCCSGQGQCLRSYFRRSRSSSRERCFSPWRSLG